MKWLTDSYKIFVILLCYIKEYDMTILMYIICMQLISWVMQITLFFYTVALLCKRILNFINCVSKVPTVESWQHNNVFKLVNDIKTFLRRTIY